MKRFPSAKKNNESQVTYRNGTSYANRSLVMYVMKTGEEENRIDISMSRKVGNSIARHHITGPSREIFRLNNYRTKTGLNIILVARGAARQLDHEHLEGAYLHLCELHHILKESKWSDHGKMSDFVYKELSEISVTPQGKDSLYSYTYILSIRH